MDPIEKMKAAAREGWSTFGPFEMITGTVAPKLVRFAGVQRDDRVLDVGCGTGVVALTAGRSGARVTGADLTPVLLERARENAALADIEADFVEADVESLPFEDDAFDMVLSQFGHMFGPRPDVTLAEMIRVLRPGGTIAFSTWPPELLTGRMFILLSGYAPPPPEGTAPPSAWGDPIVVRERLEPYVSELSFDRACMRFPTLSPVHMRVFLEANVGPVTKIIEQLAADNAALTRFRAEFEQLIGDYFDDQANVVRQDFLMTRGVLR
jgi:SAM-dependent methyltransferase